MKKNIEKITYTTNRTVESVIISDDVAIVHIEDVCEGTRTYETYSYVCPNNITTATREFNFKDDENYRGFMFFKKEFLEFYKTYNEPWDLEFFVKEFGIDNKSMYKGLINGRINIKDYIPVQVSYYDNHVYPFVYGEDRYGWFPHMVRYSQACYHVTNAEYDLAKVAEFLKKQEKDGNVIICRGPYSLVGDPEIIRGIPGYNQDEGKTEYINFYTYIDTREEYNDIKKNRFGLYENPKWKKLLEPFKIMNKDN